jgi:uncharacterized membrane protein
MKTSPERKTAMKEMKELITIMGSVLVCIVLFFGTLFNLVGQRVFTKEMFGIRCCFLFSLFILVLCIFYHERLRRLKRRTKTSEASEILNKIRRIQTIKIACFVLLYSSLSAMMSLVSTEPTKNFLLMVVCSLIYGLFIGATQYKKNKWQIAPVIALATILFFLTMTHLPFGKINP